MLRTFIHSCRHNSRQVITERSTLTNEQLRMCVPECERTPQDAILNLAQYIQENRSICVLSGAGLSTESGIPDYRSEKVGHFARSNYKPMLYHDFLSSDNIRRRYWARNYLAYPYFSSRQPNAAHFAVHRLEQLGKCSRLITQNVDGLHQKAGSSNVLELHGTASGVICINCDRRIERATFQQILAAQNEGWLSESDVLLLGSPSRASGGGVRFAVTITPDGDVQFNDATKINRFRVPACTSCGGVLRAHVVFHGDNIPSAVREAANKYVDDCDALLVVGSSLTVQSSFRLVDRACAAKKHVAIINIGPTRADQLVRNADQRNLKLSYRISELLTETLRHLESNKTSVSSLN